MVQQGRGPYTGEWYEKRNKRRRDRYITDPKYRAEQNEAAREGYRKANGKREPFDPRQNKHMLEVGPDCVGQLRTLSHMPEAGPVMTFTKSELALVFNRPAKQVQQWASDSRIPQPIIRGRKDGTERTWTEVYTQAEARAIIDSLGDFLSKLIYFRTDHVDAIDACRAAITAVRKKTIVKGIK